MELELRTATVDDIPVLTALIQASARGLSGADYSSEQIEAALKSAWGVDSELVGDGTYFVVEVGGRIVACGGWGKRATRFGGDAQTGRSSAWLDPAVDAARIRAFFVHPEWARLGIGRALLERCESEARAHGFRKAELVATLQGRRLYAAMGYVGDARVTYPLGDGVTIDFVPMSKALTKSKD